MSGAMAGSTPEERECPLLARWARSWQSGRSEKIWNIFRGACHFGWDLVGHLSLDISSGLSWDSLDQKLCCKMLLASSWTNHHQLILIHSSRSNGLKGVSLIPSSCWESEPSIELNTASRLPWIPLKLTRPWWTSCWNHVLEKILINYGTVIRRKE